MKQNQHASSRASDASFVQHVAELRLLHRQSLLHSILLRKNTTCKMLESQWCFSEEACCQEVCESETTKIDKQTTCVAIEDKCWSNGCIGELGAGKGCAAAVTGSSPLSQNGMGQN